MIEAYRYQRPGYAYDRHIRAAEEQAQQLLLSGIENESALCASAGRVFQRFKEPVSEPTFAEDSGGGDRPGILPVVEVEAAQSGGLSLPIDNTGLRVGTPWSVRRPRNERAVPGFCRRSERGTSVSRDSCCESFLGPARLRSDRALGRVFPQQGVGQDGSVEALKGTANPGSIFFFIPKEKAVLVSFVLSRAGSADRL